MTSRVLDDPPLPFFHPALKVPQLVEVCRKAAIMCKVISNYLIVNLSFKQNKNKQSFPGKRFGPSKNCN